MNSAVQLIKDYGFDGIDIDFEYPSDSAQGQGFADLLTSLRSAMDSLSQSNGDTEPYLLTVSIYSPPVFFCMLLMLLSFQAAVAAGAENYANLVIPQMDKALSYWNLMAYDYAGSWLTFADNQGKFTSQGTPAC